MSESAENEAGTTLDAPAVHRVMRRAVLVPFIAVALIFALLGWEIRTLLRDHGWLTHTEHVLSGIQHAQRLVIDHETALRAHLLVGDPTFLGPYRAAERDLPGVLAELESSTADNPTQGGRIAELRRLYGSWHANAEQAVASPSVCEPTNRAQILTAMRDRKDAMDEMRALFQSMVDDERRLMQEREATAAQANQIVVVSGLGLAALLIATIVVAFRRWLAAVEKTYRHALDRRAASEDSERQARTAAEALAAEIASESRALEARFTTLRDELEELRRKT